MTPIEQVLDLARWAPSGDNTQPWRFEITGNRSCIVHAFDTRRHCVYDLTGAPSQIAVGAMLETARIAATGLRMHAEVARLESNEENPRFDLQLREDALVQPDPLIHVIKTRCTNRRPYSRRPLTAAEKTTLEASVGPSYRLVWLEGARRWEIAKLLFASAKIRLLIPEAYEVHRAAIEWNAQFSETKVPDQAIGLDPVGLALMRWAMKSWRRTRFLSWYLGGTVLPRVQLDLLPGLNCAAHLLLVAPRAPTGLDDHVQAGRVIQRLWLTTTRLGLQHQPEMTPLIFAGYARGAMHFSAEPVASVLAGSVLQRIEEQVLAGSQFDCAVWLARIGAAAPAAARSLRQPLASLLRAR